MADVDTQVRAQKITNTIQEVFPDPNQAIGYLIGALVSYFDALGYSENQMLNAIVAGARALRKSLKKATPLVQVVSPETFKRNWG